MKKLLIYAAALMILMIVSPADAYRVTLHNTTPYEIKVEVYGEHLFWNNEVDASMKVSKNTSGSCSLPGAICTYRVKFSFSPLHPDNVDIYSYIKETVVSPSDDWGIACKDVTWRAVKDAASKHEVYYIKE